MATFDTVLRTLESLGLSDVLLPFFLIFTIAFAVLQRAKVLGDPESDQSVRTYHVVLSTILGLVVVIPHMLGKYPPNADIVNIINAALPNVAVVLVALVMVLLLVGVFGGSPTWAGGARGFIAFLSFAVVFYIFGSAANWFPVNWSVDRWIAPDTQAVLIVLAVFALIIWFITKKPEKPKEAGEGALPRGLKALGELFGGGNE
ncbi:hypothetical protein D6774_04780 [Candidatus Woesearchaeota archaeon]|nr:MAG: hypothetical protein D6774_04780 [Candidatus Woesearchaeota archaeon]